MTRQPGPRSDGAVRGEHLVIYEALQRRDPRGAEAAMRNHLANARQAIADVLADDRAQARLETTNPVRR